jgi:hypothetical protein
MEFNLKAGGNEQIEHFLNITNKRECLFAIYIQKHWAPKINRNILTRYVVQLSLLPQQFAKLPQPGFVVAPALG